MKTGIISFVVGFVFSIGLVVSGMTQPENIINFLDLTGNWDPSLAFVMIGAIGLHFFTFKWILKRKSPLFANKFMVPSRSDIDKNLLLGSALFGIGWGLGGLCPGPAIASLLDGSLEPVLFVGSSLLGMFVVNILKPKPLGEKG
ncbi:MAG: DUF6691 family protein [Bdellovibrionales bacterium]